MWLTCLRFVLLLWFPGVLHAQSAALPCPAPTLNGGYFVPEHETYAHETKLTYACENGHKPVVEGWWATSTCQNGKWSHEPQCIDENACIPPEISNAKITENPNGWYKAGDTVRITCDKGYEHKGNDATAICENGTWTSVPACEKSISVCGEPPKINHAVIISHGYQKLFAPDSEVKYECEDGYTVKGGNDKKNVFCMAGSWTEGPTCTWVQVVMQMVGVVEWLWQAGTLKRLRELLEMVIDRTEKPDQVLDMADPQLVEQVDDTLHLLALGHNLQTEKPDQALDMADPQWVEQVDITLHLLALGHNLQLEYWICMRSSATFDSNGRESGPPFISIRNCGDHPVVPNGVVVQTDLMSLKYKCNAFYTQVGSDTVVCHSDGSWSELPVCKEAFCVLDPAQYAGYNIRIPANEYLKEGEQKSFWCTGYQNYYRVFRCINGRISFSSSCSR
ncbi:complement factor H-related protein 2-like [Chaetodon trifascialis]|uniref:complement factor H-related protein 2-like n=1 Tax=Chaetodon trifascialis TaxID=109706 RepID=UPI003993AB95